VSIATSFEPVDHDRGECSPHRILCQEVGFERLVHGGSVGVRDITIGQLTDVAAVGHHGDFEAADLVAIKTGVLFADRRCRRYGRQRRSHRYERRSSGCRGRIRQQAASVELYHLHLPSN
jgi:hypothetical protein